jgi:elongation factor Ts
MTDISADLVKQLRDLTGVSIMQCRKALEAAGGDIEKAKAVLLQNSAEQAAKKSDRTLGAGFIGTYVHSTGLVGAMVELMCETDFVSKNDEFKSLARDLAMQVSATAPTALKAEDLNGAEGTALLDEAFIKNPDMTITNLLQSATQKFGEKIEISRFARFAVGQ